MYICIYVYLHKHMCIYVYMYTYIHVCIVYEQLHRAATMSCLTAITARIRGRPVEGVHTNEKGGGEGCSEEGVPGVGMPELSKKGRERHKEEREMSEYELLDLLCVLCLSLCLFLSLSLSLCSHFLSLSRLWISCMCFV